MKLLDLTLPALLALASATPALSATTPPTQDGGREAVATTYPDQLTPRLHGALMKVLATEAEFAQLTYPFDEDGNLIGLEEQQWRMNDPASPLKGFLDHHRERFYTGGLPMDETGLRDCILHDAGYSAAADLLAEHPDFDAEELLAAFDDAFVTGEPIWNSEMARGYHVRFLETHEFWPLGNGRALGRLAWGVLQQDAYWSQGERDRGAVILGLLERGVESRLVAQVVDLALASPIRSKEDSGKDGHGVCNPELPIAGPVGFDRRHEEALERDLELVSFLSNLQDPSGAFDLDAVAIEELPGGKLTMTPTQLGHLRWWIPRRLAQVREELYEGAYLEEIHLAMRRSTSLEERLMFWSDLAGQSDFASFRDNALGEIQALLAWQTEFPGTERLRELMDLDSVGGLTEEERAELWSLRSPASRDRDRFMGGLIAQLVGSGLRHDFDSLVTTLSNDLPAALAPLAAQDFLGREREQSLLNRAWFKLATSKEPERHRILAEALDNVEPLPLLARDNLIWAASKDRGLEATANLQRVIEVGSPRDRAVALMNPGWAREDTYITAMGGLVEDVFGGEVDHSTRLRIEAYFTTSLENRPVTPATRELLLASLRDENWSGKNEHCYWGQTWASPERFGERLDLVRKFLGPAGIDAAVAEGIVPGDVF